MKVKKILKSMAKAMGEKFEAINDWHQAICHRADLLSDSIVQMQAQLDKIEKDVTDVRALAQSPPRVTATLEAELAGVRGDIRQMNEMLAYLREGVILDDATKLVLHEQAEKIRKAARESKKITVPGK